MRHQRYGTLVKPATVNRFFPVGGEWGLRPVLFVADRAGGGAPEHAIRQADMLKDHGFSYSRLPPAAIVAQP